MIRCFSRWFLMTVVLLIVGASQLQAQDNRFQFDPKIDYSSEISSPAEFLGYRLGSEFTLHSDVMQYFKYLAENSDRLSLHKYAETYEGRELYYAVVSSDDNMNQINQLRTNNLGLANPDSVGSSAAERIIQDQPITVWLSYNVHGNEPSSSESA